MLPSTQGDAQRSIGLDGTGSDFARTAILEVVHNQLGSGDPPETRQTLDRLIAQGRSEDEAMQLIAAVVVTEVFNVLTEGQPYNKERYVKALFALPKLPDD